MIEMLARRWWLVLIRGMAAVLFGVLCFARPFASLAALVIVYGCWAIVDGAFNLGSAVRSARGGRSWGWLVFEGVVGIAVGVLAILWPGITALALLWVIAAWMVITGIAELAAAIALRKFIRGELLLALAGVLSVVAGVLLVRHPGVGALAVVFWIGAYAVLFGLLLIGLAFRLRSWGRTPEHRFPTRLEVPA
jgi:uncharacterized membrane protein HdeD (DUF308 family)